MDKTIAEVEVKLAENDMTKLLERAEILDAEINQNWDAGVTEIIYADNSRIELESDEIRVFAVEESEKKTVGGIVSRPENFWKNNVFDCSTSNEEN